MLSTEKLEIWEISQDLQVDFWGKEHPKTGINQIE